jgi:PPM family protein phosphatase
MSDSGYSIRLLSGAKSDKGMQRSNNEDSVQLWGQEQAVLAVVADGMGGAAAGEEASRIAVDTIKSLLLSTPYQQPVDYKNVAEDTLVDRLAEVVRQANLNIIAKAVAAPELKGMGTTMTLAFARGGDVVLAHVGDSRAYLVDGFDHTITQLTADHSFVQALVDAGHITEEEAETHPMKNVLYRALGQNGDVDVDLISGVLLNPGDRIIMSSDGLTLHVKPSEIAKISLSDDDPQSIAARLVDLANKRGGRDNISVVVIVAQGTGAPDDTPMLPQFDYEDDDPTLPMR